ncbi:hypothetical protein C3F00_045375, partial [Pseudomonas sp. MWU13-2860]
RALLDGEPAAYALCRPPGHHARAEAAGGFCYLNNAAIAAQVLRERYARVAVLDTDMHHGQGIQEIFYERADVLPDTVQDDPTNLYPAVSVIPEERSDAPGERYHPNRPLVDRAVEADLMPNYGSAFAATASSGSLTTYAGPGATECSSMY